MSLDFLHTLRTLRNAGKPVGIASICSAHPLVLEAALLDARDAGTPALIEATCNQVNQFGGYTGMTPLDFRENVWTIADTLGMARDRLILGGDHLGPNPWTALPSEEAMQRAEAMVDAYVRAGFRKIHLDCSMSCSDDPARLPDTVIAERAARLCKVAEHAADEIGTELCYVIGTEVPAPGGVAALEGHIEVTPAADVEQTMQLHAEAFARGGLRHAIERVLAIVVQPGVEFGTSEVCHYDRERAAALPNVLSSFPGLLYEAHSTDYQHPQALRALVEDGFAILKVGPWLTFALREALYGLDFVRSVTTSQRPMLAETMERLMLAEPRHWQSHYSGPEVQVRIDRHFSYSDRIRYYWNTPEATAAVRDLMNESRDWGPSAFAHCLPRLRNATRPPKDARSLVLACIGQVLDHYRHAANG